MRSSRTWNGSAYPWDRIIWNNSGSRDRAAERVDSHNARLARRGYTGRGEFAVLRTRHGPNKRGIRHKGPISGKAGSLDKDATSPSPRMDSGMIFNRCRVAVLLLCGLAVGQLRAEQTPAMPPLAEGQKPLPINLPTALQLTQARAIDIAVASERIRVATAELQRANVLWLPTIYLGTDYFRHDGQIQAVDGSVFGTSKSAFMIWCAAPYMVFAVSDAIFGPLAARQVRAARQADLQTATNDTMLAVAEAYFNVQQSAASGRRRRRCSPGRGTCPARGTGARPGAAGGRSPRTELARRRQVFHLNEARWRTTSAELIRLLRLDPSVVVQPADPPHLLVTLFPLDKSVDDLIPIGLTNRPELASQQVLVQAALQRLRQERIRPLVPSVLLRGARPTRRVRWPAASLAVVSIAA